MCRACTRRLRQCMRVFMYIYVYVYVHARRYVCVYACTYMLAYKFVHGDPIAPPVTSWQLYYEKNRTSYFIRLDWQSGCAYNYLSYGSEKAIRYVRLMHIGREHTLYWLIHVCFFIFCMPGHCSPQYVWNFCWLTRCRNCCPLCLDRLGKPKHSSITILIIIYNYIYYIYIYVILSRYYSELSLGIRVAIYIYELLVLLLLRLVFVFLHACMYVYVYTA